MLTLGVTGTLVMEACLKQTVNLLLSKGHGCRIPVIINDSLPKKNINKTKQKPKKIQN